MLLEVLDAQLAVLVAAKRDETAPFWTPQRHWRGLSAALRYAHNTETPHFVWRTVDGGGMRLPQRYDLDPEAGELLHQGERGGVRDALAGLGGGAEEEKTLQRVKLEWFRWFVGSGGLCCGD